MLGKPTYPLGLHRPLRHCLKQLPVPSCHSIQEQILVTGPEHTLCQQDFTQKLVSPQGRNVLTTISFHICICLCPLHWHMDLCLPTSLREGRPVPRTVWGAWHCLQFSRCLSWFPHRYSASSRACPSPWPALPCTTRWCLGSSVTRRGSSASSTAGSLRPARPTPCQTCSWPAWWPAWCPLDWARLWTSSRSACRCKHRHFGKVRGLGGAWCLGTCDPLLICQIWGVGIAFFLLSRASMWSCNSLSLLFLYLDRNSHWLHIYHVLGTAESSACVLLIRLYAHSVRQMLLPFPFTEEKTEAPRGQGTNSGT